MLTKVETQQEGNMFDMVWLLGAEDQLASSGARDSKVCLVNVERGPLVSTVTRHWGGAKKLVLFKLFRI